jgi:hypothetical protein
MGLGGVKCRKLAGVMMLVAFVFGLLAQIDAYLHYAELRDHGKITAGYITAREANSDCPDGGCAPGYSTTYEVLIEDQSYSETVYGEYLYDVYREGDAVDVLYSPTNPALHKLAEDNQFDLSTALGNQYFGWARSGVFRQLGSGLFHPASKSTPKPLTIYPASNVKYTRYCAGFEVSMKISSNHKSWS